MDMTKFDPTPGVADLLEPGVRRVLAANPSAMTQRGTNTYIVGQGRVAVIDPGPADPVHMQAILGALQPGEAISHIFVTHSHLDHSPLAAPLSQATGAPVLAFGDSLAGRSTIMDRLARAGLTGGGEGVDRHFAPHESLTDGMTIVAESWTLTAIWTPGHFGNHLCFAMGDAVFSGDHVMGWSSSLVSPPDGDLHDFMASTERLGTRADRVYYPGHGAPVGDPAGRTRWLLAHRRDREAGILARLTPVGVDIATLTRAVYAELPPALLPAAERNVFAHLIDLYEKRRISAEPTLAFTARFARP